MKYLGINDIYKVTGKPAVGDALVDINVGGEVTTTELVGGTKDLTAIYN